MDFHVSPSQLKTFMQCQGRWFFRYHPDFMLKIPPNAFMAQGTSVHKAQEVNYRQKIKTYKDLPVDDVLDVCHDTFKELASSTDWQGKSPDQFLYQSLQLAELYHTVVAPNVQPVAVEEGFETVVYDVLLVGYIDVVQEGGIVRDTKTTAKRPKDTVFQESLQVIAYDLGHKVMFGQPPQKLVLDYLVSTKEPYHLPLEGTVTEKEINRFMFIVKSAIKQMKRILDDWEENPPMLCEPGFYGCHPQWCGYWDICHDLLQEKYSVPTLGQDKNRKNKNASLDWLEEGDEE